MFHQQWYFFIRPGIAFVLISAESDCPRDGYILRGTNGSISSPEYPLSYPDSVKCTWIIEVPEGYRVRLEFQSFQLETCTIPSVCTCDHVEVRDGRDATGNSLERSCGDKKPSHLRSSGRFMWIEFESDSNTTRNGFHAIFNALCKCPVERSAFSLWKKNQILKSTLVWFILSSQLSRVTMSLAWIDPFSKRHISLCFSFASALTRVLILYVLLSCMDSVTNLFNTDAVVFYTFIPPYSFLCTSKLSILKPWKKQFRIH